MNVTNTTIMKSAIEKTDHATYKVEYTEENGMLVRVVASVYRNKGQILNDQNFIGTVSLEGGYYMCSIPTGYGLSEYIIDFINILDKIGVVDEPASIVDPQ